MYKTKLIEVTEQAFTEAKSMTGSMSPEDMGPAREQFEAAEKVVLSILKSLPSPNIDYHVQKVGAV